MANFIELPAGPGNSIHVAISNVAFIHFLPNGNEAVVIFQKPLTLTPEGGKPFTTDQYQINDASVVGKLRNAVK